MKKRLISLVMALVMVLSLVPFTATAYAEDPTPTDIGEGVAEAPQEEVAPADTQEPAEEPAQEPVQEVQELTEQAEAEMPLLGGATVVCEISGTVFRYGSIKEALASATDGQTIRLLCDVKEAVTFNKGGKTITLDLNGYMLRSEGQGSSVLEAEGGELLVTDTNSTTAHYFVYATDTAWEATTTNIGAIDWKNITADTAPGAVIRVNGGCITGGSESTGGAIWIAPDATVRMYGGNLVGNQARKGGAVYNNMSQDSFHMYGGAILGNYAQYGGGIYNDGEASDALVELLGGTVAYNVAEYGGGVYNTGDYAKLSVSNCEISHNYAQYGGGICNSYGVATLTNAIVAYNAAGCGGGIYSSGYETKLTVTGGKIHHNTALSDSCEHGGGGIYSNSEESIVTLTNVSLSDNTAVYSGGGVLLKRESLLTMVGGSITSCSAKFGGAVDCSEGSFHLFGGTLSGNTAVYSGGAVYNGVSPKSFHMHGGTVTGNHAGVCGGGLYTMSDDCTFNGKCTVTGNTAGADKHTDNVCLDGANLWTGDESLPGSCKGALLSGSQIGITLNTGIGQFTPDGNGTLTDLPYFTSDNAKYKVAYVTDHLELVYGYENRSADAATGTDIPNDNNEDDTFTRIQVIGKVGVKAGGLAELAIEEKANVPDSNVKMVLEVEEVAAAAAPGSEAIKASATDKKVDFLNIDLTRYVNFASVTTQTDIHDTNGYVIEVLIPYNATGKTDIEIYHYHSGGVTKFEEKTDITAGTDGTFYVEGSGTNAIIHLFTTKFSTYAVAYKTTNTGTRHHGTSTVVSATTGDMGVALYAGMAIASLMGTGYVARKRRKF